MAVTKTVGKITYRCDTIEEVDEMITQARVNGKNYGYKVDASYKLREKKSTGDVGYELTITTKEVDFWDAGGAF